MPVASRVALRDVKVAFRPTRPANSPRDAVSIASGSAAASAGA